MALRNPATKPRRAVPVSMNARMAVARTTHISAKTAGTIELFRRIVCGDVGDKVRTIVSENECTNVCKHPGQMQIEAFCSTVY